MSETRRRRHAGQALLVGVLLPLLILGMHPTAHDLAADSGSRMTMVNHLVHGVALFAQPIVLLGLVGVSWVLGWTTLAVAGLICYSLSVVGMIPAALASGFIGSDVVAAIKQGGDAAGQFEVLLTYTHFINQAFARCSTIGAGLALVAWGAEILTGRRLSRASGVVGLVVGAVLALGVLTGFLRLDVRGILLTTALQAVWMGMVALQLLRMPEPGTVAPGSS